ncbi:MAG: acetate kinase [Lachnospiraceae bacterium]|nr:acetate kinase [Lachnospiraceae bacterium]
MKILVLNCGSSSLKYQLIDMEDESVLAKGLCERIGIPGSRLTHRPAGKDTYEVEVEMKDHRVAVELVMKALLDPVHGVIHSEDEVGAIGHRVLHGGKDITQSCVVDANVKWVIRECFDLGPLHNPANLIGIEACEAAMPGKVNVAVFDTSFGMGMKPEAYRYAIPDEYYEKYGVRRYGFHGTSHDFVSHEALKYLDLDPEKGKVIVCHLGNGASISASVGGVCVDTSMGLTPLEGLIMGTRSGDVDPAVVQYITNKEGITVDDTLNILNKKSGMAALSGVSSDFRDIEKAYKEGNEHAILAMHAYIHRLVKYIGAYNTILKGADAIVFTAGVGENGPMVRRMVCEYLEFLGVKIDEEKNLATFGKQAVLSTPDSTIKVAVIPTNEELAIARDTLRFVQQ